MFKKMRNIAQGQVGVHRLVAELIARGHAPYLPVVDTGVDILLGGGVRIQVKTTLRSARNPRYPADTFLFTLSKAQTIRQQKYVPSAPRNFSEDCDFVVLLALEANRLWIVPAHVLDGRWTVVIYVQARWREVDLDAARQKVAEGKSWLQIGRELGVSGKTVQRRLTGHDKQLKEAINLPQYEGRWDLIDAAFASMNEKQIAVADAVAAEVATAT